MNAERDKKIQDDIKLETTRKSAIAKAKMESEFKADEAARCAKKNSNDAAGKFAMI